MQTLRSLQARFFGVSPTAENTLRAARARILRAILIGSSVFGLLAYFANLRPMLAEQKYALAGVVTLAYAWVVFITLNRRVPYTLQAFSLVLLPYLLALANLLQNGLNGDGLTWLFTAAILASVLLGLRWSLVVWAIEIATLGATGWLVTHNLLILDPVSALTNSKDPQAWLTVATDFFLLGGIAVSSLALLLNSLEATLQGARHLTGELEKERAELETRARENEHLLEQTELNNRELAAINQVAAGINKELGLEAVLEESIAAIVNLLGTQHSGIVMARPNGQIHMAVSHDIAPVMLRLIGLSTVESNYWQRGLNQDLFIAQDTREAPIDERFIKALLKSNVRSFAFVPLRANGQLVGILNLGHDEIGGVPPSALPILHTLGDQIATAIVKARLISQIEKRAGQLQTAAEASRAASSILELADLLRESVELIRRGFGLYYVGIFMLDEAKEWAVLRAGTGEAGRLQVEQGHRLQVGESSMIGWSIQHKQARIALDTGKEAVRFRNPFLPETRSEMALPLISRGEIIGALSVQSTRAAAFDPGDITTLQTMADQLANALENARLFQETERHAQEAALLNRIITSVIRSLNLRDNLQLIAAEVANLVSALHVGIALVSEDKNSLILTADAPVDPNAESPLGLKIPIPGNPTAEPILKTRKPLFINDAYSNPLTAEIRDLLKLRGTQSLFIWPIVAGGEVIGSLGVDFAEPDRAIEENKLLLIETILIQTSTAIQNARLFTEVQQLNQAIQSSNDAIIATNIEGNITQVNAAFTKMTGYAAEESIGKTPHILKSGLQPPAYYKQLWDTILAGNIWRSELVNKRKNGSLYTIDQTILPIRDNQGNLTGFLAIERDITASKQAQESLARSEGELRALFASMEDIVLVIDKDTRYIRIAPTNPSRLFLPPQELLGRRMDEILPPETHEPFRLAIHQALETDESVQIEYKLPIENQEYWFLANISKLNDEQVFWVARDITERKRQEEAIRASEARFRAVAQSAHEGIISANEQGAIVSWNRGAQDIFGYPDEEITGRPLTTLMPRRYRESHRDGMERYLATREARIIGKSVEVHGSRKDGSEFPLELSLSTWQTGEGVFFTAIARDITQRKQAEAALKRRNEYLSATAEIGRLVTSTLDLPTLFARTVNLVRDRFGFYHAGIFIVEETGFVAILREATGEAGAEMKRQTHQLAVGSKSIVGKVTAEGKALVVNNAAIDPTHKFNPLLPETRAEAAIPLRVGGRIIGALDIQSTEVNAFTEDDIAVLQTLADQIAIAIDNARSYELSQQAVMEMREIDRLKSEFLANMSHELRTPLNSIIGFSRVILKGIDGPITDVQEQDLAAIYSAGQHLLGLINDVLDLSKIEAGKMELAFDEVNLANLITSVMSTTVGLVKGKPIQLKHDLEPGLPTVQADGTRLRQVLLNLLANAAKFTDEGEITVHARSGRDEVSGQPEVIVSVQDTGIGIAQEDRARLFEAFSQIDASPTRQTGGTGLGLAISRQLIELHGGRIWLESEVGRGSTFFFSLPRPQAEESLTGNQVIIGVDDSPGVLTLYRRYLEPAGYHLVSLTSTKGLVATARKLRPLAILMDIIMPEKSGWDAIAELKAHPETAPIPVIVCTISSDRARRDELGIADFLPKPVLAEDLLAALEKIQTPDRMPGGEA